MRRLKLVRGRSYTGYGVRASAESPYIEVDKSAADALIATGYFEEAGAEEPASSGKTKKSVARHGKPQPQEEEYDESGLFNDED